VKAEIAREVARVRVQALAVAERIVLARMKAEKRETERQAARALRAAAQATDKALAKAAKAKATREGNKATQGAAAAEVDPACMAPTEPEDSDFAPWD